MKIKCITLWEPWATAMVLGFKTIETRSRNTRYRGELHIHSSKKKDNELAKLCKQWPFNLFVEDYDALPFGMITGRVEIYASERTEFIRKEHDRLPIKDWSIEEKLGNYEYGRFGYFSRNPEQLAHNIPATGTQIIPWEFEIPDHLHVPIKLGGHATFTGLPSKKQVEAVNAMAELAFKNLK